MPASPARTNFIFPYADEPGTKVDISDQELKDALSSANCTLLNAAVLGAIDSVHIPSQDRQNVKKGFHATNKTLVGMPLGVINTRHGIKSSAITYPRQNLVKLLSHWVREAHPGFCFTSIQVNKNTLCDLHVDKSNLGPCLCGYW